MNLFSTNATLQSLPMEDGELALLAQLPLPISNAEVFARLRDESAWRHETVVVYGKRHLQPRLTAWYGKIGYTYSGLRLAPTPLTPLIEQLRSAVEAVTGHHYNSVLLNYYRDGADSMGMHSDDEPELGATPAIASLSYGATRSLILRHKRSKRTFKLPLEDGNLLLMAGAMQQNWLHGINKTAAQTGPRINLTFRYIG